MRQRFVFLLGSPDRPTDALEDYSRRLGVALERRGHDVSVERVRWDVEGTGRALAGLWRRAAAWRGSWVLPQYTQQQWSARGFPVRLAAVTEILHRRGARPALIVHDPMPAAAREDAGGARRLVQRARGRTQELVLRLSARRSAVTVLTVPPLARWTRRIPCTTLPVGPNIPGLDELPAAPRAEPPPHRVAVFGFSPGEPGREEAAAVLAASRTAASAGARLTVVTIGRGDEALRHVLAGCTTADFDVEFNGLAPADEVARTLDGCHAQLFARRDGISSRRGSAVAGIARGLAIVAFAGPETGPPVTEAGVRLAAAGDAEALGNALAAVLHDGALRAELEAGSRRIYQRELAWDRVAERLLAALGSPVHENERGMHVR